MDDVTTEPMVSNWPHYVSHKVVQVAKIVGSETDDQGKTINLIVQASPDAAEEKFMPTQAGMEDRVGVGDYAMLYPDGFRSVQPAAAFEGNYSSLVPELVERGDAAPAPGPTVHEKLDTILAILTAGRSVVVAHDPSVPQAPFRVDEYRNDPSGGIPIAGDVLSGNTINSGFVAVSDPDRPADDTTGLP